MAFSALTLLLIIQSVSSDRSLGMPCAACTSQECLQLPEALGKWKQRFHVLASVDIYEFSFP